jgi:molybdenum storage protein
LHKVGRIPSHRTDVGAFLTAEVVGAWRCILVKDEPGLFTDDPKRDPEAEFIAELRWRNSSPKICLIFQWNVRF